MQRASYNVEDLFCRARALNLATWAHEAIDMFPARCDDYHETLRKTPERA